MRPQGHLFSITLMLSLIVTSHPVQAVPMINDHPLRQSADSLQQTPPQPTISNSDQAASSAVLDARLAAGLEALKSNQLDAAAQAFNEAAVLAPTVAAPYLGLAEVASRQGNKVETAAWLDKAMAAEPENVDVLLTLARFRLVQGQAEQAEQLIGKALQHSPTSVLAHLLLGDTYLQGLKQAQKAETAFRQALELDEHNVGGWMGLAAALSAQGKTDDAFDTYLRAAQLVPTDPRPLHNRARLLAAQTRLADAIEVLDEAIRIAPTYLAAYIDKGDLHLLQDDYEQAIASYREGSKAVPDSAYPHFKLAVAFQARQQWSAAEQSYLAAIERDPRMFGAYNNLAWILAQQGGNLDRALNLASKAIQISPQTASLHDTLGTVYLARQEAEQAARAFAKAVELDPERPDFAYRLGMAYKQQGKIAEAKAAFKRALDMKVDFPAMEDAKRQLRELGD